MWLDIRNGTSEIEGRALEAGSIVVGRDAACDLVIDDERASRRHARLTAEPDGRIRIEDLGSTNGTWVDGSKLSGAVVVAAGSEVRIGRHYLRLDAVAPSRTGSATPSTEAAPTTPPADGPPAAQPPFGEPPVPVPPLGAPPLGPRPVEAPVGAPPLPVPSAAVPPGPVPALGTPVGRPPVDGPQDGPEAPLRRRPAGTAPAGPLPAGPPPAAAPPVLTPPLGPPGSPAIPAADLVPPPTPVGPRDAPAPPGAPPVPGVRPAPLGSPPFGPPEGGPTPPAGRAAPAFPPPDRGQVARDNGPATAAPGLGVPAGPPPAGGAVPFPPGAGPYGPAAGRVQGPAGPYGPPPGLRPGGPSAQLGGPPPPTGPRRRRRTLFLLGGGSALVVVVIALVVFLIIDPFAGTTTFTAAQLSAKWGPSTLYVQVSVNGTAVESGSGWVLNASEGLVVTNAHVVDGGNSFQVGQGPTQQPATLVGVSPCDDLAVLKIQNTTGLRSFVIGSQSTVQDGDTVTALGYPANSAATPNLSVTTGVVSVAETQLQQASLDTPQYPDLIQTSAAINPGNSGGPLLDDRGRVIGINSAGITEEGGRTIQGEGYAIGIDHAKAVLTQLAAGHSKGFAGFNFTFPTSAKDFSDLGLPVVQGGIIVASADPDSTAYNAGFGHDDPLVITAINGTALNGTLGSYCHLVGGLTTSQTAKFTVEEPSGRKLVVVLAFE